MEVPLTRALQLSAETKDPEPLYLAYRGAKREGLWELCREAFTFWSHNFPGGFTAWEWDTYPRQMELLEQRSRTVNSRTCHPYSLHEGLSVMILEGLYLFVHSWTEGTPVIQSQDPTHFLLTVQLPLSANLVLLDPDGSTYPGPRFPFPP